MATLETWDLHPDRLATTDENGRRIYLHPSDVKGPFRSWRTRVQAILIVVFLALPWIRIDGRQLLLLNVASRKFEIFGLSLRAHNAPLLFLVLATLAFGIFAVTAVWGRVWCGWACPQTVFIDGVFRRIERWIEGPGLERRKLDQAPMSFRKFRLRAFKWALFTLAAGVLTHSFLAYFVGGPELLAMISGPPSENWPSFLFICATTAILLFDFGWFREQFCIIACPYGRFQSVLMDDHSMIVAYDAKRGEPRRQKGEKPTPGASLGDCVNCYRCVQVCPTGVDIRRGTQMECVTCTACIDACDEVMSKMKRPTGLIRYDTQKSLNGSKTHRLRARPLFYASVSLTALLTLLVLIALHEPLDVQFIRARGAPYEVVHAEGKADVVVNRFTAELSNQSEVARELDFDIAPELKAKGVDVVTPLRPLRMEAGAQTRADVFVRFPKTLLKDGAARIHLTVLERGAAPDSHPQSREVPLVGPFN